MNETFSKEGKIFYPENSTWPSGFSYDNVTHEQKQTKSSTINIYM